MTDDALSRVAALEKRIDAITRPTARILTSEITVTSLSRAGELSEPAVTVA